jgi:ABC-type Fe3+-hydroxamate transport system substrate-binding protein
MALLTEEVAASDRIVAVSPIEFAYNPEIRRRVQKDGLLSAADPTNLIPIDSKFDIAFVSDFGLDAYKNASLSAPPLVSAERDENSPLGRAEYVKLFGIIFDQTKQANNLFDNIVFRYQAVRDKAFTALRRPSVVLNLPFGDIWTMPGGDQYITQFLRDANVDYRFANDGTDVTKELSYDDVKKNFASARFWINMATSPGSTDATIDSFLATDTFTDKKRAAFKSLAAVKCGHVWAQSKRISPDGKGSDFFESGAIRPDLVLSDLIKIFHPKVAVSDGSDLYFYVSLGKPSKGTLPACPYNELPAVAGKGKVFVTSEYEIAGKNRFQVEDVLPSAVSPAVAKAANVTESDIEIFFDRAIDNESKNAFMKVRAMVPSDDAASFDEVKLSNAIASSLGAGVTSKPISSVTSDSNGSGGNSLSAGAIVGIVLGALALLSLAVLAAYLFAAKRTKQITYAQVSSQVKDRFWEEHGVRLAEDAEDAPSSTVA